MLKHEEFKRLGRSWVMVILIACIPLGDKSDLDRFRANPSGAVSNWFRLMGIDAARASDIEQRSTAEGGTVEGAYLPPALRTRTRQ